MTTKAKLKAPADPYKSSLEREYAQHLEILLKGGEILRWRYEAFSFRIGKGARYQPDFYLLMPDYTVQIHETKGHWREAAKVRARVAADLYPEFTWKVVTRWPGTKAGQGAFKVETVAEAFGRKKR